MRKYLTSLVILILVLISQLYGLRGWNMRLWGFDVFMHIFGGLGLGLFVSAFLDSWEIRRRRAALILISVLIFGLIWELFEIKYNIARYELWSTPYYIDTAKDLVNGIIGAGLSLWITNLFFKENV